MNPDASGEFELIARHFAALGAARTDVALGVGDDGAVLDGAADRQLVAVVDTLVEGVHFLPGSPPASIGHRALAVNLSDIAAMGATPAWALLALSMPRADDVWLAEFARGFDALARAHGVALVGGDTTSGPVITLSVTVLGWVPPGEALRRAGARAGDLLCISGTPGDAARGLELERRAAAGPPDAPTTEARRTLRDRFLFPRPRCELGVALRGLASACIDVSDGLLGDADKLLVASGCEAVIATEQLPISTALQQELDADAALEAALTGGDDYELLFAIDPRRWPELEARLAALRAVDAHAAPVVTPIGVLRAPVGGPGAAQPRVELRRHGSVMQFSHAGFDHFARA